MSARTTDSPLLRAAVEDACRLVADDPAVHQAVRWLPRLYARCKALEDLLQVTDRYLRFGMPEAELAAMRRLVEHLREQALVSHEADAPGDTLPL